MKSLWTVTTLVALCAAATPARAGGKLAPPPATPERPKKKTVVPPDGTPPVGAPPASTTPSSVSSDLATICAASPQTPTELKDLCDKRSAVIARPKSSSISTSAQKEQAFPPGYYSALYKVDVCKVVAAIPDEDQAIGSAALDIQRLCGTGGFKGGEVAAFGIQLVQGLGDFLVARAKQETVNYAIDLKAESLCDGKLKQYLQRSCVVLFPPGAPPDLTSATDGRLQTAIRQDLASLPKKVLDEATTVVGNNIKDERLAQVIDAIGLGAISSVQNHDLARFFDAALAQLPLAPAAGQTFACRLDTETSPSTPACVGAFTLEVGSKAMAEPAANDLSVINDAASVFCTRFGPLPTSATTPGQCVFGAEKYPAIQTQALAIIAGVRNSLAAADETVTAQIRTSSTSLTDTVAKVGPTIISALVKTIDGLVAATKALVPPPQSGAQPAVGGPTVSAMLKVIADLLALANAVAARDGSDALAAVESLVQDALALDQKLVLDDKALAFVLAIATAKSRDDVEAALEAAADPLGSYRIKYGPHSAGRVTINGFVGLTGGLQRSLNRVGSIDLNQRFGRLSAPVGLDVNVYGWNYMNLGAGARLIDPLALTVVTQQTGTVTANWASLIDLGAYVRMGIARSPFSLLFSFDYLPGLEPSNGCETSGTSPCWRGAWQLSGSIAVDIPILTIH